MSNELQTILANNPAIVQTGLDADTLAVAGGNTGSGSKRISIRGKNFHKVVNGKEVATVEDNYRDVIIVKMSHTAARTYYASAYKEGVAVSPACWSGDSNNPDKEVPEPQASSCSQCPQSVKGSGMGGTGSACRLSWRIAVVLPNDPSGDILQMVLPATSAFGKEVGGKWPFRPYVQMLANNNVSAGRVVTRMQFDAKSSVPRLLFSPVSAVSPDDVEMLQRQGKAPDAEAAVKMTVYQTDSAKVPEQTSQVLKTEPEAKTEEVIEEPEVVNKTAEAPAKDITDIMDKWGVKD